MIAGPLATLALGVLMLLIGRNLALAMGTEYTRQEALLVAHIRPGAQWTRTQHKFQCCGWNRTSGWLATGPLCNQTPFTCRLSVLADESHTTTLVGCIFIVLVMGHWMYGVGHWLLLQSRGSLVMAD